MREIKFRAWDGQKMYLLHLDDWTFNNALLCHRNAPLGDVMQFTGIKDNSGVEIYEGDIITHIGRNGCKPHQIIWDSTKAAFCGSYGMNYPLQEGEFYGLGIEVIGNIYENPELL